VIECGVFSQHNVIWTMLVLQRISSARKTAKVRKKNAALIDASYAAT
jgi:hypothetical protein